MSRYGNSVSFGSVMIWFGLLILITLPILLILINRKYLDVDIKGNDNTIKKNKH